MNTAELIARINAATGVHAYAVAKVLKALGTAVAENDEVSIAKLGKFKHVQRAARVGRNPRTGEPVTIPAKVSVTFGPSAGLKAAVNA